MAPQEIAVFRRSTGTWMIDLDGNGSADRTFVFGRSGDVPLRPNGWIPRRARHHLTPLTPASYPRA
jgi:hypothetical protein